MTSELEIDMDGIVQGDESKEEVVEKSREMLKDIMVKLQNDRKEISQEIKKAVKEDFIIGNCMEPGCTGNLLVRSSRKTKKRFIGCSSFPSCTRTFSLPQNGLIVTTKEKCRHCDYPVVRIVTKGRKPWDLCINMDCPGKDEKYKNFTNNSRSKEPSD
jgi:DNA topoisomerase-1